MRVLSLIPILRCGFCSLLGTESFVDSWVAPTETCLVVSCRRGFVGFVHIAITAVSKRNLFDLVWLYAILCTDSFGCFCALIRGLAWAFPEELFSVLRTVHLLRGLSVGLGINYSCAQQWRPLAEEAMYLAGRLSVSTLSPESMQILEKI
ncbi:hypothetical protein ACS0TY_034458 [Phlomoides rotata]